MSENLLRFVTPRVAELLERPIPTGVEKTEKEVALLFLDIEGCSQLCENLPPRTMNELIEFYFSRFLDVIQQSGGTVSEFMGDGFMAIFEGNEYEENIRNAATAAVEIRRLVSELKGQSSRNHYDTQVHIGVHAGLALVGFTKFRAKSWERWTYTASGPVTNIAARLCQLAPGGAILVSGEVGSVIKDSYPLEALGPQKLRNVNRPPDVFKLSD